MTYTNIIALIGCITGCISLSISLYRTITERFQLKVILFKSDAYIIDALDLPYLTNQHCILHMEFINKSNHPICVYAIDAFVNGQRIKSESYPDLDISVLQFYENTFPNRKQYLKFPMDKQLCLPIRLQPHDTHACMVFYPFFPDCGESEKIEFSFRTTKRTVKKSHVIHRLHASEHNFEE